MARRLLLIVPLLLVAAEASAQTQVPFPPPATSQLAWDHDGINVDRFELQLDGGTYTDLGLPPGNTIPFPPMTPGAHTIIVCAANLAGRACSAPFPVSLIAVPTVPAALRIVTGGF